MKKQNYIALEKLLASQGVTMRVEKSALIFTNGNRIFEFLVAGENSVKEEAFTLPVLHQDQLIKDPEKIASIILSKLGLNKTVFARNCKMQKVEKKTALDFLEKYHILNSTQSAYNFGLYYKDELIALATFSKGRKMNRLKEDQRSFELIRFCCKSGITVTGGLTRLIKNFCEERKAGDIMTYVDKQLSDGKSFISAGFKKHSENEPNYFLVNKTTFERTLTEKETEFDKKKFYMTKNSGNIKLVYTPLLTSQEKTEV